MAEVYAALAYFEDHREEIANSSGPSRSSSKRFAKKHPELVTDLRGTTESEVDSGPADEHISDALADALRRRGCGTWFRSRNGVSQATPDEELLALAFAEQRVLLTKRHRFPGHRGIDAGPAGDIRAGLYCRNSAARLPELLGRSFL